MTDGSQSRIFKYIFRLLDVTIFFLSLYLKTKLPTKKSFLEESSIKMKILIVRSQTVSGDCNGDGVVVVVVVGR